MEPFQVFPELVWREIFDKIEDDKDKLSFIRAHSAFRKLFENKHVELGFLSALPILLDFFEAEARDVSWKVIREKRESILSCRLVSRKCCQAVDNWMESYWENEHEIHLPLILCKENQSNITELWTRPQVEKFTKHFGALSNDRMPILSRSLNVAIPLNEEGRWDPNFEMNVQQELEDNERRKETLTAIGKHLKSLTLNIALSDNPGVDNVDNLRERIATFKSVLEQVPNLKSLSTSWEPICNPVWEEDEGVLAFPKLPQLIHLSLNPSEMPDDEDVEIFVSDLAPFEKYFPQLIYLDLFNLDVWKDEYMDDGMFPKLRHLQLINVFPEKYNHRRKLLRMCRKLFAPNLVTLSVHIHGYTEEEMDTKATYWMGKLLTLLNKLFKKENAHWCGCQGKGVRLQFWRV